MEKVTRQAAATAVEEILVTPRVLNAERYGRLIEELGALVRGAGEQSESLRRAAEELRAAQAGATRTLEDLRARSETIARSVAMIDQRLARGESLVARATEQVQRAQEATARVESLSLPDATEVERRIAGAERAGLERIERTAHLGAETIEALVRDAVARATASAIESARVHALETAERAATARAHAIAEAAATACASAIIADAEARVRAGLETGASEREAAIRSAIVEQATESTKAVEAALDASIRRGTEQAAEIAERGAARIERAERDATERVEAAIGSRVRELDSLLDRAAGLERLGEPGALEAADALLKELNATIATAAEARQQLEASAENAANRVEIQAQERDQECEQKRAERPSAVDATMDTVWHGDASVVATSGFEAEAAALEATRVIEDRVRAATAHVEALVAWLGHVVGHAQQTGAALEMLLSRSGARPPGAVGTSPTGTHAGPQTGPQTGPQPGSQGVPPAGRGL